MSRLASEALGASRKKEPHESVAVRQVSSQMYYQATVSGEGLCSGRQALLRNEASAVIP